MKIFKNKKIHDLTENLFFRPDQVIEGSESMITHEFMSQYIDTKKFLIVGVLVFLGCSIVLGKAFHLQIVQGSSLYAQAEGNRSQKKYIIPHRGIMYDSKMQPLVKNEPVFTIGVVPEALAQNLQDREKQIQEVSTYLSLDPLWVTEELQNYPALYAQTVSLKTNINYEEALQFTTTLHKHQALALEITSKRQYVKGFSHILGYVGKINQSELERRKDQSYLLSDMIGKTGLELTYETELRGVRGVQELEIDASGRVKKILSEKPAIQGTSVQLTIDEKLQTKVREVTVQHLKKIGEEKAVVIMMNPSNGAILSMISIPEFDNNDFSGGISKQRYASYIQDKNNPLFDRAIKGEYPSGSTIKIIVGAAALEEHVITERTGFWSTGGIRVLQRWFFPDWRAGGHGYTTIYKAIADSVNTFFYIIGGGFEEFKGLGLDNLIKYYKAFGLGERTGIDLPGESTGLVPSREWKLEKKGEQWYIGDTYHMAIGQGDVLVTPLQVALYTSVFANGGTVYRPQLVQATIDPDGVRKEISPIVVNSQVADPYTISVLQKAMRQTITEGSGRYLSLLPVSSAGKTGTAQFSSTKDPHAWFTAYAPYENPEVVITVLIEEGKEGSSVAVPIAYDILNYYFTEYKQLTPEQKN